MKNIVYLQVLFILIPCLAFGQHSEKLFELHQEMGWSSEVHLEPISQTNTTHSIHTRYQQYYRDYPVLGGQVIFHDYRGEITHSTEVVWPEPLQHLEHLMTADEAYTIAQGLYPHISWPLQPKRIWKAWADAHYPLCTQQLRPVWCVELLSTNPHSRYKIIIDAINRSVILNQNMLPLCHQEEVLQPNQTLYHGVQEISWAWNDDIQRYFLSTEDQLSPILTWKADSSHYYHGTRFISEWDTTYLGGALDAHWSIEQTRNFLFEQFGRDGITGSGDTIKSYIYPLTQPFNNAFWNGEAMYYGAGDTTEYGPFTSIDICAHEYLHGVTEHTAGLEYTYESGALNESISDIFGKILEHYAAPQEFSWFLGERILLDKNQGRPIRSMSDPNDLGSPKYYKGRWWWTNPFDNGGVHINSGVLNYWFYLLVEGGQGITEKGEEYDVQPIGWEKATELVYGMLENYLTPTSQYVDARDASYQIVRHEWTRDAAIIQSVSEAWYAVGLGYPVKQQDLSLTAHRIRPIFCDDLDLLPRVDLINQSLEDTLPKGSEIILFYSYKNQPVETDTLITTEDWPPGEVYSYQFRKSITENDITTDSLTLGMSCSWDLFPENNEQSVWVERIAGLDFEVEVFQSRDSRGQCERGDSLRVFFAGEYHGCSPISSRDSFLMTIQIYGDTISRWINPVRTVYPGAFVFFGEFDFTEIPYGVYPAVISFSHSNDPVPANDTLEMNFYRLRSTGQSIFENFEDGQFEDSTLMIAEPGSFHKHGFQEVDGETAFVIGSKGVINAGGEIDMDTNTTRMGTFMLVNQNHVTNIRMCVQTDGFINPQLEFEVMRQNGDWDREAYGTRSNLSTGIAVGFPGFIEYLTQMPYDEFVRFRYDLPKEEEALDIRIQNLVLWSDIDSITGEILNSGDRIVYRYIHVFDRGLSNNSADWHTVSVFPNPTDSYVLVNSTDGSDLVGICHLMTEDGVIINRLENSSGSSLKLSLPEKPGAYLLFFQGPNGHNFVKRIIRQP